ncbi:hypothetical protein P8452_56047 [Trifolium repens]|nr:hypothetical protein P8452_56047 [Trifolium repens]
MDSSLGDMLVKVAMFFLVQALVYLILSNSSNIFSKDIKRSNSFKPARSVSIRRMLAYLSDFPPEGGFKRDFKRASAYDTKPKF